MSALRTRTWLKRIGIALALLIVLASAFAFWLLATEPGARFALGRAKSSLTGKLLVARLRGTLVSPLELEEVEYSDAASGIAIKLKSVHVEDEFFGLLKRVVHVRSARIEGLEVALTTVPQTPTPKAPQPTIESLLTPPIEMLIDQAHVGTTQVSQDGKTVFRGDGLDLAATWTSKALNIGKLALRAPDGSVDLNGSITSYADLTGQMHASIDWRIGDEAAPSRRAVGTLDVNGDGKQTRFALALAQPLAATAGGTLAIADKNLPWTVALDVPAFDAAKLAPGSSLHSLALSLKGSGDRSGGSLSGTADANRHRVLLDPLKFTRDEKTLTIESLILRSPEAAGTLTAHAQLGLDATPPTADATIEWRDVELPAELVGQKLATHGQLVATGNAQKYAAHGALSIGPPGQLADIALRVEGSPDRIKLQQLDLKQPRGSLHANGDITLKPKIGWDMTAKAQNLDPGAFAKEWPGAVNFDLATQGHFEKDGPAGKLKLEHLGGSLRKRPIGGAADVAFSPPLLIDGKLDLTSGSSHVSLLGRGGAQTDVLVDLAVASLGDWIPRASGSVNGKLVARGAWPRLDVSGHIAGTKLVQGDMHLDGFAADLDVRDISTPGGSVRVDAKALALGGYLFDTLRVDAKGTQATHHVEVTARGKPADIDLALDGAFAPAHKDQLDWRGTLGTLDVTFRNGASRDVATSENATWKLARPTTLGISDGALRLDELCMRSETSALCASAQQDAKQQARADLRIEHLPLALLARLASPDAPLRVVGEINGGGSFVRAPDGAITGQATLVSDAGSMSYPDAATQALLSYRGFKVAAVLSPQQHEITIASDLNDGGRIDGRIVIGAGSDGALPLSGNVAARIDNLSFVDLLTTQLSATRGNIDAKFNLSGTTRRPGVDGALTLSGFSTEVPAAGLKLHDGLVTLRSRDGDNFDIDGAIASAEGRLSIKGSAATGATAPVNITIKGEDFLAADIPGARMHVSPDIVIVRDDKRLAVTGVIGVPQMYVDLTKLPGGGAPIARSPDVVIVDEASPEELHALPANVDVTLKFGAGENLAMDLRRGKEVHLIGYGLDANMTGQLAIHQSPGAEPVGRGQLQLDGTYKAYGQDLTIEQGRLLFAGTPVANPGLDIRATRSGFADQNVTVGMQVRGTALMPQLTVFSTPAMEQSDALSYLVAGKPLSQLKGGEGNAVGSAASALGTATGDMLAKSIGAKTGLDDVGVADSSAIGGAALTVGKYLSPRLYLGYGVGLFTPGQVVTLRYKLTRLFEFEMQNGSLSSRAGINYRIEK